MTRIHSAAGVPLPPGVLIRRPPMRAPHHSASLVSLIGGGSTLMRPGELSCAHHGVLFLDELGEFPSDVLDTLRQPLEEGRVLVCRARASVVFPARVLLVAAMNPCPCGSEGGPGSCRCRDAARARYASRVSGPLLDRFDLRVMVDRPDVAELLAVEEAAPSAVESTDVVARRVAAARALAAARGVACNAALPRGRLDEVAPLEPAARRLLEVRLRQGRLSARGLHRVRRVARTLADLAGRDGPLTADDVYGAWPCVPTCSRPRTAPGDVPAPADERPAGPAMAIPTPRRTPPPWPPCPVPARRPGRNPAGLDPGGGLAADPGRSPRPAPDPPPHRRSATGRRPWRAPKATVVGARPAPGSANRRCQGATPDDRGATLAGRIDPPGWWARSPPPGIGVTWPGSPTTRRPSSTIPSRPASSSGGGRSAIWPGRAWPSSAPGGPPRRPGGGVRVGPGPGRGGICVVSGLALGIDGAAHAGALAAAEGRRRAPVPSPDRQGGGQRGRRPLPRRHAGLWEQVVASRGDAVGDAAGTTAQAWRFPARNRIIAGLVGHGRRRRIARSGRQPDHRRGGHRPRHRGAGGPGSGAQFGQRGQQPVALRRPGTGPQRSGCARRLGIFLCRERPRRSHRRARGPRQSR